MFMNLTFIKHKKQIKKRHTRIIQIFKSWKSNKNYNHLCIKNKNFNIKENMYTKKKKKI